MSLPIILDCDPGHDDAIALILALASPELELKAVTTSAGNQTPDKTLRNALRILTAKKRYSRRGWRSKTANARTDYCR